MRIAWILFTLAMAGAQPLHLDKTIPLAGVQGRIDHMSVDVKNQRLFVAALGNNTVEVIDIRAGRRTRSIGGFAEPQGVLYLPGADRLFVAGGGDGTLRIFNATSLSLLKTVQCGEDADNVRYDAARNHIYVGYGNGSLGEFDTEGARISDIHLDAHPESFQLEKDGPRILVNLPKVRKIAVVDRNTKAVIASWTTAGLASNYPMALEEKNRRLFVVFRQPARMLVLDGSTGKTIQDVPAVGDSDDVFYDPARKRIYASGGEGAVSVFQEDASGRFTESARMKTVSGARTSFFAPELGLLFVACRRAGSNPAEIRIYSVGQ